MSGRPRRPLILIGIAVVVAILIVAGYFATIGLHPTTSFTTTSSTTTSSTTSSTSSLSVTSSTSTNSSSYTLPPTLLDRVVVSKMYQQQRWIDGSETAATIGDALAMLKPTLVSELIRLSAGVSFTPQMIQNYNTVRSIVLQSDPGCEFDIALNMDDYGNASSVTSEMAYINSQITVEGFMFDFMGPAYSANPAPTLAAIQYAHSHNQFITGHIWGANSVPPGIDYISTDTDGGLQLRTTLLQNFESEYPSLPVNVEINQNPQNNGTSSYLNGWAEACYYKYMLSDQQKLSYLTSLAQNQTSYHYHFEYPLEFPTCGTFSAYDPLADGSAMVSNILNIMNQYNSS